MLETAVEFGNISIQTTAASLFCAPHAALESGRLQAPQVRAPDTHRQAKAHEDQSSLLKLLRTLDRILVSLREVFNVVQSASG